MPWPLLARPPFRRASRPVPVLPPTVVVETPGGPVEVDVRSSPRARRFALRLAPGTGRFELVVPEGAKFDQALRFAEAHGGWIAARLAAIPARIRFLPGSVIPLLGRDREIRHIGGGGVPVVEAEGQLIVAGGIDHVERRVQDFLKARARAEIVPRARGFAETLGKPVKRISLRDPKARWGSCSARGDINFSWRLVMAPESVLTYVVAHEAAHLVELNHGIGFWRLVDRLVPDSDAARSWLQRHGSRLHRFG